jgi:hypothetical protein
MSSISLSLQDAIKSSGLLQVGDLWIEDGKQRVRVRCQCGSEFVTRVNSVKTGNTSSCGCKRKRTLTARNRTHGMGSRSSRHPLYRTWANIIQRCTNANNPKFKDYGGRGITVCDRWKNSFANFLADVGDRPFDGAEIDRINNDLGYEKSNVRWASRRMQTTNTRRNRIIVFGGSSMSLTEWATELGWSYCGLADRIRRLPMCKALIRKPKNGKCK